MDYKLKYLKYKNKYLNLKNQIGGDHPNIDKFIINLKRVLGPLLNSGQKYFTQTQFHISTLMMLCQLLTHELLYEITNLPQDDNILEINPIIKKFKEIIEFSDETLIQSRLSTCKGPAIEIINRLCNTKFVYMHACDIDEFMRSDIDLSQCTNKELVRGSCGDPSFFNTVKGINTYNTEIIKILELIETKLEKDKTIAFIIGPVYKFETYGDINLYFNNCKNEFYKNGIPKCDKFREIPDIIVDISNNPLQTEYKIKAFFPLNQTNTNKYVLDFIIYLTEKYKIILINKMCGSCFRSFYYLTNNCEKNFTYIVNPEQSLSDDDTTDIRECFKSYTPHKSKYAR